MGDRVGRVQSGGFVVAVAMTLVGVGCAAAKAGPALELDPSVRVPVVLLQDYSQFREEVGCWLQKGEHPILESAFEDEECARLSWEAVVRASHHSTCSKNEDCRVLQSDGLVGPDLIAVQREWIQSDDATRAAIERECGTWDVFPPRPVRARCVAGRCVVQPERRAFPAETRCLESP